MYATNDRDQTYAYDGLQRLKNYRQGTLSGASISGTPTRKSDWTLDQLGNWDEFDDDNDADSNWDLEQTRQHNMVNEVGTIGATSGTNWADPVHDAAGNMTSLPMPYAPTSSFSVKYDAWNRLVEVKDAGQLVQENEYDGLGQRIVRKSYVSGDLEDTHDYYYNHHWQLLTEVKDGSVEAIYHWHPFYVDALAVRMRASDTHFFLHDANFNVTAAVDNSTKAVVDRYAYTPYGEVTFLNASFSVITGSAIGNQHLYTGRERDWETGLQLNRNRFYAAHLGSWANRDPIGYWGGMNLYGYVGGMPTYYVDPSGLGWREWALGEDEDDTPWIDRGKGKQAPPVPDLSEGPLTPIRSGQAIDAEGISSIEDGAQTVFDNIPGAEAAQAAAGRRLITGKEMSCFEQATAWGMALSGPIAGALGKSLKPLLKKADDVPGPINLRGDQLPAGPYSPHEVSKRMSARRDQIGLPAKDPDIEIPNLKPGPDGGWGGPAPPPAPVRPPKPGKPRHGPGERGDDATPIPPVRR